MTAAQLDSRIGHVVAGRYRVIELIGRGSMGVVYRAERVALGRSVAIKFLLDSAPCTDGRMRFEIEARAASRMNHPNCVPVIDFGLDEATPFLVMEYVRGRTLRHVLSEGALSVERALRLGRQVLAGLSHAHEHGIVHRDIKPENMLVWSDGLEEHIQIVDFGLAKLDALSISQNVAVGTPSYMSPEQTLGEPVDARSDVYAAGVLLYELLADQKPFRGRTPFDTMCMHRDAEVPRFDDVAAERAIAPQVEAVIRRALEKSPSDRFRSAIDLAHALEDAMEAARIDTDAVDVGELLAAATQRGLWRPVGVLAALASAAAAIWLLV